MTLLNLTASLVCALAAQEEGQTRFTDRLKFSAFADFTLGTEFGGPADSRDQELFEAFGTDEHPLNSYGHGFGAAGVDFVLTASLTDSLVFQGEVNLQVGRGGSSEIELDFERFYLDYRYNELINVQAGFFFTPIGYHNRFLYSRAWLMHSVQVPDLFEEELNLVPTHSAGLNLHGTFNLVGLKFNYAAGIANGRGMSPTTAIFARDSNFKEVTLLLEWKVPGFDEFLIGVSGWHDQISTVKVDGYGTTVDIDTAEEVTLRELGFNPYITYFGKHFNLLAEFIYAQHHDLENNLDSNYYIMHGASVELSLNLMDNKFHPYIRWDYTKLPSDQQGPYYGLRADGDTITRYYIPEFHGIMIGVNYDINANVRIKLEYERLLDGPRDSNAVVFQIAYGF